MQIFPYILVYLGAGLMVYNIYGFVRFARKMKSRAGMNGEVRILYIPIFLLLMFLLGYLLVAVFGKVDWIISGILFGGSIFVQIVYILLDRITGRIIESEQLEVELKAAEETNREKNAFLASISHEMRTPMNMILGLDSLALKNPELAPETRDQLEKIGRSGRHLMGLINNILEMQSMESGRIAARQEIFSLEEAVGQVSAIAETMCGEKRLTYRAEIAEGLPERVRGDAMMLKQVLLALLDNAVKFTDAPGQVLFIAEKSEDAGEKGCRMRFRVKDTGIGIAPEFLPKVFELFAQEDGSYTNRFGGSGLGLPAAKQKTELMGGEISVTSEKNRGTEFTVTLCFPAEEEKAPAGADQEPDAFSLQGRRILIVDDVEDNAEIAADLLELEGAESERAENGQAALDLFSSSGPGYYDAVLMDLRMPVMDGMECARRIRALNRADAKTIPIIALTANSSETDIQQSLEAGMNAHLVKPADAEQMYVTLREWIGKAQEPGKEGGSND